MAYLADDPSGAATAQITRLLRDPTTDNAALVLELMAGGGVNERLKGYLFGIAVMHAEKQVATRALQLLGQHTSPDTVRQANRLREATAYHYNEAEYLGKYANPEFDVFDFVFAQKMCHWHKVGSQRNEYFLSSFRKLDLTHYPNDTLTPGFATLDFVHHLTLPARRHFDVDGSVPLLAALPLNSLYVESVHFDTFPVRLLTLPQLRFLSIRRGAHRPRQPMIVPAGGPHGSAVLEKLVIENYPMRFDGALGPFPALREFSSHRTGLTSLDFLAESPQLQRLVARHQQLEQLPPFIGHLVHLRYLDLTDNPWCTLAIDFSQLAHLDTFETTFRASK